MNPLFKKHVHEGDNPTTYIPATKRREIYDYMGKVNYNKHLESKLQSIKSITFCLTLNNAWILCRPKKANEVNYVGGNQQGCIKENGL